MSVLQDIEQRTDALTFEELGDYFNSEELILQYLKVQKKVRDSINETGRSPKLTPQEMEILTRPATLLRNGIVCREYFHSQHAPHE